MICKAPVLYVAVMVDVVYAVLLKFNATVLVTFGVLFPLFLQEFNVKANKIRTKNAHFSDFMVFWFWRNVDKYYKPAQGLLKIMCRVDIYQ